MSHWGTDFAIVATSEFNVWRWQFRIADQVATGRTEPALLGMAACRARLEIDEAIRQRRG
jgi:hypothetical protein